MDSYNGVSTYEKDLKIKNLPEDPGVYKFFNSLDKLIYVGKAKNLKKRVTSYFNRGNSGRNRKTRKLIEEINRIEYVVVNSEFDALLLENNFIKQYQPKYNILLKDDKSYPFICITYERFPQIFYTRNRDRSQGDYFGPYTSVRAMKYILELVKKLYHIRTCNYNLSVENINNNKFKVCLEYHLGNCLGPCEGLQNEESYNEEIENAKLVVKGKLNDVRKIFIEKMNKCAESLDYENAEKYKQKLHLVEKFQAKSIIVNEKISDIDVISLLEDNDEIYINYMMIIDGAIKVSDNYYINNLLEESHSDIANHTLLHFKKKFDSNAREVITNVENYTCLIDHLIVIKPKIGDKKKLLDLSMKNVKLYKQEKYNKKATSSNEQVLIQLKSDLNLLRLPEIIECFDNSNIQGSNPVASMVTFKNGKPFKQNYRHYNIKTVDGPDDFKSMAEVIYRRYNRIIKDNIQLPDLIVIDGGKGQLKSAIKSLKDLNLYGKIPIIGIAKRLEEIYFPEDKIPIHLAKNSTSIKLLQYIRNEAHRFAINFHRKKRSSNQALSKLDAIKGIGEKSKNKLYQKFNSIDRIKELSFRDLSGIIGEKKTKLIFEEIKKGSL